VVIGICRAVGFTQELEAVHAIFGMAGTVSERPSALIAQGVDDGHADRFLEALECAQDDGAVRPGTGERDVKMITTALGLVRRGAVALHPIAERIFLALELAGLGLLVGKLCHRSDVVDVEMIYRGSGPIYSSKRISFVPTKPSRS